MQRLIDYYISHAENSAIDYDRLAAILGGININVSTIHTSKPPSMQYIKKIINYYIEHDYNITHHIFGGGATVNNTRSKRFSFSGLFESSVLAICRPILHIIHEFFIEILEPILIRIFDILTDLAVPLAETIFHLLSTLFEHISKQLSVHFSEESLLIFFENLLKSLFKLMHKLLDKIINTMFELNSSYKILETVILFLIMFYIFRAYIISIIITLTTIILLGIERTESHNILVILIVIFLSLRFLSSD
uniref:Uncharacterized protein n=1 Tax=Culex pseudovishnui negev-like virus TaxID=2682815 RepID=A0A6F8PYI6_9VIRU|nr:hypothetical protein 2 [Culex pseudovishnui negev-like virus]